MAKGVEDPFWYQEVASHEGYTVRQKVKIFVQTQCKALRYTIDVATS